MFYQCSMCDGQWSWETDDNYCGLGVRRDEAPLELYYPAAEMDKHIKVNIRLINKFREFLYAEHGKGFSDIWNMYETLYKEQMQEMPLPWYEYVCAFNSDE